MLGSRRDSVGQNTERPLPVQSAALATEGIHIYAKQVKRQPAQRNTPTQSAGSQRVMLPLIGAALVLLVVLYQWSWSATLLQQRDRSVFDEFHRQGRKTPARDDIVVLGVDEKSLSLASAWPEDIEASPALQSMKSRFPWPRRSWAHTIDRLMDAGARMVFLDFAFIGPNTEEDDRALSEALKRHAGKVIIGARFDTSAVSKLEYPSSTITGQEIPEDGTWGYMNYWAIEGDSIVRHARYQTTRWKVEGGVPDPDDKPIPSIALAAARKLNVSASADVHEWERIRFAEEDSYAALSLHEIFVPDLWKSNFGDGSVFKNKVVLIGATAQESQDFQLTPVGSIAGVRLHAHALTALLANSFLYDAPRWWLWLSLIAGAVIAWLLVTYIRQPVITLLAMWSLTVGAAYGCFVLFNKLNLEASPIPLSLALNGCGLLGLTGNFLSQLREKRKLTHFIQRYHSPEHVAAMLKDRENLFQTLGGVERSVTILFSDVRGFTSLSEGMKPEELVAQLNEYLSGMVERVFVNHGSIDKFIGDAVMALWGSMPATNDKGHGLKRDAQLAVTSALAMREALVKLNADWRKRDMPELRIGIGVHQGDVVVGNIGSAAPYERMELTVIGDSVNLTSRLEGLTKDYECDLIVSENIQHHIRSTYLCRPLDIVKVKGKAIAVKIYFVQGLREGLEEPEWWQVYDIAIEAFRSGDKPKARELFEQCRIQVPDDKLVKRFIGECA